MLNTMTSARFFYKGYVVHAERLTDALTKKDFGWTGKVGNLVDCMIVAKSVKQFEKKFIQFVEKREAENKESFGDIEPY